MEKVGNHSSETDQISHVELFVLDGNTDPTGVQKVATTEGKEAISRDTPTSKPGSQSLNVDSDPHKVVATPSLDGDPAKRRDRPTSRLLDSSDDNQNASSGRNTGVDPYTAKPVRRQAWLPKPGSTDSKTPILEVEQLGRNGLQPIKLSDEAMSMKHAIEVIMLNKINQRRDAEAHFRSLCVSDALWFLCFSRGRP
jgi:hypothetical protein